MTRITGRVIKRSFGEGSKSAHEAVILVTTDREYKLRRQDGNPFNDPILDQLVGKTIQCEGIANDYIFIMSQCTELAADQNDTNSPPKSQGKRQLPAKPKPKPKLGEENAE